MLPRLTRSTRIGAQMARTQRETFHIIGQSDYGAVPTSGAYVVVDTSVLSIIEGLAINGYVNSNVQHRRAASFLRWLEQYDVDFVNTTFAVIEGSGFHAGGVSFYNVLHRSMSFEVLRRLSREDLDEFLASGEGLKRYVRIEDLEEHYKATLDDAAELLLTTLGPSYLVTLKLRLCFDQRITGKAAADKVMAMLADELNLVPGIPWVTTLLACFGTARVRRKLVQEVLKHPNTDIRKSVLSGAWDCAYLQLISNFRSQLPRLRELNISAPVIVTDDNGLAYLSSCMHGEGHGFMLDEALLDPGMSSDYEATVVAMWERRLWARPGAPDLPTIQRVANVLEDALDIPHSTLAVEPPIKTITPNIDLIRALLRALNLEREQLLHELVGIRPQGDVLVMGLLLACPLVEDNASAHERTSSESFERIVLAVRRSTADTGPPTIGEMIVSAVVRRDTIRANALLEQVEVVQPGLYGSALLYLAVFLRVLLIDTAAAYGEQLGDVLQRLEYRFSEAFEGEPS